jgi:Cft2 family RNA processing exonuclease
MNLVFLGGADEVGASCTLIEIGGLRVLVDAGIRVIAKTYREIRDDQLPDLQLLNEYGAPDYIFITHVHTDHTGALPLVVERFPHVPVYATAPTVAMVQVLQADSQRLMTQRHDQEGELPLYDEVSISRLLKAIQIVAFYQQITLNDRVKATLYPAGHILGAAAILLESDDESVLLSGDISLTPQRAVGCFEVPSRHPDVLVIESTYGGKLHPNRVAEEKRLVANIQQVIERGGKVLIPAFALGRAQEVLQILLAHRDVLSVPIYVDGMVRAVCAQFDTFRSFVPAATQEAAGEASLFFRENVSAVQSTRHRDAIIHAAAPCIVVSSSGMLSGGPSVQYAKYWASDPKNAIFLTGYQDEESPGQHLYRLARERKQQPAATTAMIQIEDRQVALACAIESYSISAHADEAQIVSLVESIKPAQVALVHGDNAARQSIASKLRERNHHVHLPISGQAWLAMPTKAQPAPLSAAVSEVCAVGNPLEQNEARNIGLQSFPPEARLRKISFDSKRKRMMLTFDFPDRVRDVYAHQLGMVAEACGWRVEVNPVAIQQALETAVYDLLPSGIRLVKPPSVFAQRREVEIVLKDAINKEALTTAFYALTGYRLDVRVSASNDTGAITFAADAPEQPVMEINSAYRAIREMLEPHGLQKVGRRNDQLVLTFISPEVGMRQEALIASLARTTGYDLTLNPHPDQRAILLIVNHELRTSGWLVRKGPGIHQEQHEIVVHLYAAPDEADRERVAALIEAQTGYQLTIKVDAVVPR